MVNVEFATLKTLNKKTLIIPLYSIKFKKEFRAYVFYY